MGKEWAKGNLVFIGLDPGEQNSGMASYIMNTGRVMITRGTWKQVESSLRSLTRATDEGRYIIFTEEPIIYKNQIYGKQAVVFAWLKTVNAILKERHGEKRVISTHPTIWATRMFGHNMKPTEKDVIRHLKAREIAFKEEGVQLMNQHEMDALCILMDGMDNFGEEQDVKK